MIFKMYSIRDSKAEIYHPPFFKQTHGEAERDFATLANNDKTTIGQHPEDFDLYQVGQYDDQTGKLLPQDTPTHIAKAVHFKKNQAENPA